MKCKGKFNLDQDSSITMRVNQSFLNEFKLACGNYSYQVKIKDLMKEYINKVNNNKSYERKAKLNNIDYDTYINKL